MRKHIETIVQKGILSPVSLRMKMVSKENFKSCCFYIFVIGGLPIEEFCGLRAKMYSIKSPNHVKKTAKGVSGQYIHMNKV